MMLGAIAGGFLGIAGPLAGEVENPRVYTSLGALGAIVGMTVTKVLIRPASGSRRGRS